MKLHPDWPEFKLGNHLEKIWSWDLPTPVNDLAASLGAAVHMDAGVYGQRLEKEITLGDIEAIEHYAVSYGGCTWEPGDGGSSELDLKVFAKLKDGRYAAIKGWNDYTGWGCQDGAVVKVGNREDVIHQGLDAGSRRLFGLEV